MNQEKQSPTAMGKVVNAFGNLLQVEFDGSIRQGEVAMVQVDDLELKAEVIEIVGNVAKIQVFEDTKGVQLHTPVRFTGDLLEAELGPGLLSSIFDGLQNPLAGVADEAGLFLPRGLYLNALDRNKNWEFEPKAAVGDVVKRGDTLGITHEGRFRHQIMVPFKRYGTYTITWVIEKGSYTIDTVVAKAKDESGNVLEFTMVQKWPIKSGLMEGEKIRPSHMMDAGLRILDTQVPIVKGGTFCSPGRLAPEKPFFNTI